MKKGREKKALSPIGEAIIMFAIAKGEGREGTDWLYRIFSGEGVTDEDLAAAVWAGEEVVRQSSLGEKAVFGRDDFNFRAGRQGRITVQDAQRLIVNIFVLEDDFLDFLFKIAAKITSRKSK